MENMVKRLESTYKDLKLKGNTYISIYIPRLESTYKDLKQSCVSAFFNSIV